MQPDVIPSINRPAGIPAHWSRWPGVSGDAPVIFYMHGGGFTAGCPEGYRMFSGQMSRVTKCRVLLVAYRLAPEHKMPAGVEDIVEAYKWLIQKQSPSRIIFAGDSAGGGMTALALQSIAARGLPRPAGGILMSPWLDFSNTLPSR